jgi:hypothetical protein
MALVLGGAGAAFAYFTSTGTGTGTGSVGTAATYTVVVSAPTGGPLTPGSEGESFTYTVQNPGSGTQQISGATISVAPDAAHATAGCLAAWYQVSGPGIGTPANSANQLYATPVSIPGGTTSSDAQLTFTVSLVNAPVDQSACEGDAPVVTVAVH